jgi:peroxiredoxin
MSTPFTLPLESLPPSFSLPATNGRSYGPEDFAEAKVLVIFFSCVHCPYVTGSDEHTRQIVEKYRPLGVEFAAINSNSATTYASDSLEGMTIRMDEHRFPWVFLRDESQEIARAYGALRTPHFYVFDSSRRLVYCGRSIDTPRDWTQAQEFDLERALDEVLEGKPVSKPLTNPIGCNVKWEGQASGWMPAEACDLV